MHYLYIKAPVVAHHFGTAKVLPVLLFVAGLVLLSFAVVPILNYQLFVAPRFAQLVKPVADGDSLNRARLDSARQVVLGQKANLDMTRASNWFPTAPRMDGPARPSQITHYNLSIPKLKIKEAVVEIGGEDLKKSLIHYPGTALPGQFGNAVIFGHSVLPQFFDPKNYLTIFSTLPTLKLKEEVLVDFDGVTYKYVIEEMTEVKPDDISVLEQRYDDSYITLITCVPPGTYLRRLVIRARLAAI